VGVYYVSVDAADWAEDDLMVGVRGELGPALAARGLGRYEGPPGEASVPHGEGDHFEEKLFREQGGFVRLLHDRFSGSAAERIPYWSMIVPVAFDEPIELNAASVYDDTTTIGSSFVMQASMTQLAELIELPSQVPSRSDNLDITDWFDDVEAGSVTAPSGAWRQDMDTAFYVALFLRAAEFSIRRSCPMRYI
jgi:hypothetical protein